MEERLFTGGELAEELAEALMTLSRARINLKRTPNSYTLDKYVVAKRRLYQLEARAFVPVPFGIRVDQGVNFEEPTYELEIDMPGNRLANLFGGKVFEVKGEERTQILRLGSSYGTREGLIQDAEKKVREYLSPRVVKLDV